MSKLAKLPIFTIPASHPFLNSLVKALLAGNLPKLYGEKPNQFDLTEITLYMPNRRSIRALQDAFLKEAHGRAMLLPKIFPISEGDEDFSTLTESTKDIIGSDKSIAPAISEIHRRLELSKLILDWSKIETNFSFQESKVLKFHSTTVARTPAQAVIFSIELARLLDAVESFEVNLESFKDLVPENFSEHWEKTLKLIQILSTEWPAYLSSKNLLSSISRRNLIIDAEAERLKKYPPLGPVIIAGITNCAPATARLIKSVLELPNGALVLPSLDMNLDFKSWQRIPNQHPEHPQYGLSQILKTLGVERSDVIELIGDGKKPYLEREAFFSEAMRPSSTTDLWHSYIKRLEDRSKLKNALDEVSLIEAPTDHEEAEAIALILREALETPNKTAALVTPDRNLARKVSSRLHSWGIRIDDSAGRPFSKTVQGTFLELIIDTHAHDFAPVQLMSLLKHPLTRLGLPPQQIRYSARVLEITTFRRTYFGAGLDGIKAAVEQAHSEYLTRETKQRVHKRLRDEDWKFTFDLIDRLREAFSPLLDLKNQSIGISVNEIANAHLKVAENISKNAQTSESTAEDDSEPLLWQGEAADAAQLLFQELIDQNQPNVKIQLNDYADFYRNLIVGINVRPLIPAHPRLFIWGPIEARLQNTDILILGSLNEGTWPASSESGPWLSREMKKKLGLPCPEEKIGLAAHDFFSFVSRSKIILTRSEKIDGVPTVPSRWINRISALLQASGRNDILNSETPWLDWARQRNTISSKMKKIECPSPKPPLELRPRKISVSQIETFMSNPYAIFAKEILKVEPLQRLGHEPDMSLHGRIIHETLSRFTKLHPQSLPDDISNVLKNIVKTMLKNYYAHPRINAFWLPRFLRFAEWFSITELERRKNVENVIAEQSGSLVFDAPYGPFTLTARADRIDITSSAIVITDYKTGVLPNNKRVLDGYAPQLPLEAAIASRSGFPEVPSKRIGALRYIRITGGHPSGEEFDIKADNLDDLASNTLDGLIRYVARFDDYNTPYKSLRKNSFSYKFDDYSHLARVDEWATSTQYDWDGAGDDD